MAAENEAAETKREGKLPYLLYYRATAAPDAETQVKRSST
jgi:hypothetical protein